MWIILCVNMAPRSFSPKRHRPNSTWRRLLGKMKHLLGIRKSCHLIKCRFIVGAALLSVVFVLWLSVGTVFYEKSVIGASRPLPTKPFNGSFPLYLHQVWFKFGDSPGSTDNPPKSLRDAAEKAGKANPTFKHKIWNKEEVIELIKSDYPWFLNNYNNYPYDIQRADAARYFIMHKYGGVYLDMDEITRVPLQDIIDQNNLTKYDTAFFSSLPSGISNHFLIARERSPFISYLISELAEHNHYYLFPYFTVMFSTGPRYLTGRYIDYPRKDDIFILSRDQLASYIAIIGGGSWHHWDGQALNLVYPYLKKERFTAIFAVAFVIMISVTGVWCIKRSIVCEQ